MNGDKPGAVVVGTGFGLFTHVRALRDAGFEVRAIVGRDRERTATRAAPLGIPLATDRLAEALADTHNVLVTVATPPHAHYPVVMEAIAAGRHVVCEKPFARDLPQAREMLAAAQAAGIIHMLGAEFRFDSGQALLRRVVQDGMIGAPRQFMRIYHQPGLQDPTETLSDWWEDAAQGGGFLGAFGTHMIDQVISTIGPIIRVSAVLQTLAPGRPRMTADDSYSVQFECENGAKGLIVAAMAAPGPLVMATKIVGSEGGAWIQSGASFGEAEEVWVSDKNGARRIAMPDDLANPPPTPFPVAELIQTEQDRWHTMGIDVAPYARLFGEMRRRIAGTEITSREVAGNFVDAVQGQAVLDAARRSSAENRWVDVEALQ
ncbi:gfo/Idh/MocA family oxidoreductase [Sphingomonas paeninsulae]|jgi:predicted dehydrogenase|uniref:Gfo/Idh/MocA family oxidoreductase n=1 Tax=Sphingomonas paeninsulae TaxID=2319844 RepID=A0A494TD00_SPHPE|nr:Gfo/Idh/MocA family oxidoreductase [Sphingomonas paeninsulae]AYJ87090.1 gfo/Idh/MocA family oxidoreductase [Sphingomonas paeninsulae]